METIKRNSTETDPYKSGGKVCCEFSFADFALWLGMELSRTQRRIIVAGVVCLAMLAFYVPWIRTLHYDGIHQESAIGYRFIFNPPASNARIDAMRTVIPMGVVVIATIAGVLLTARSKSNEGTAPISEGK